LSATKGGKAPFASYLTLYTFGYLNSPFDAIVTYEQLIAYAENIDPEKVR